MKLDDLRFFVTDGDIVPGCFIMCPTCEVGSDHNEWLIDHVVCPHCDAVIAIECPDCGAIHCSLHGPELDIAPPFPTPGHSGL